MYEVPIFILVLLFIGKTLFRHSLENFHWQSLSASDISKEAITIPIFLHMLLKRHANIIIVIFSTILMNIKCFCKNIFLLRSSLIKILEASVGSFGPEKHWTTVHQNGTFYSWLKTPLYHMTYARKQIFVMHEKYINWESK